jgi:hypothetical protein
VDHDGAMLAGTSITTLAPDAELVIAEGERYALAPRDPGGAGVLLAYTRPSEQPAGRARLPRRVG